MKVTDEIQSQKLQFLANEGFILKPNYEWHHLTEKLTINQSCVETYTDDEWDRMEDSFRYYLDND